LDDYEVSSSEFPASQLKAVFSEFARFLLPGPACVFTGDDFIRAGLRHALVGEGRA